jgi:hypothetical protein
MYFTIKNTLKNNHHHNNKYTRNLLRQNMKGTQGCFFFCFKEPKLILILSGNFGSIHGLFYWAGTVWASVIVTNNILYSII